MHGHLHPPRPPFPSNWLCSEGRARASWGRPADIQTGPDLSRPRAGPPYAPETGMSQVETQRGTGDGHCGGYARPCPAAWLQQGGAAGPHCPQDLRQSGWGRR